MARRPARKNIYTHGIDLTNINIKNAAPEIFRKEVEGIAYRGYKVEDISDGRKIVITKPGGKFVFGSIKREDFMVWIYAPKEKGLYLISHRNVLEDLEAKGLADPQEAIEIIYALERVYRGEDPEDVLKTATLPNPIGESPEVLLKAYKWIWGQEDANYPDGKGRAMSWEGIRKDDSGNWQKTGLGIIDLKEKLEAKLRLNL
ncbi:MAG: hypothetical protein HYT48_03400 [Candidatus Vogelbacteria bacterium]|nr:hypothetical protein [Candidatus Vogelbacteria bacterium]